MVAILVGTFLPWLLIAVGTWLGYQLVRQNGRILLRLDSIDRRLARKPPKPRPQSPGGLPIGSLAPDFELPNLAGERCKLSDLRGRDRLLIFFNPQCGFCVRMAADLAALPIDGRKGRPIPLVITTGDVAENRRFFEEHGIHCDVLLQEQMQTAAQYDVNGTPIGYLIDSSGNIASEQAVGAEALLQLASGTETGATGGLPASANGHAAHGKHKKDDPSLAKSRINRSGLKAGTPAPEFVLPRIDGGELSLATFRGSRVLLVFSDPDCGPCDVVAPLLQEVHEERSDLQVLVVSRRDADAVRRKADKFGLTYPTVLQKQWEISLKYGMFATPIGYLIDERGIIVRDVAIGVEPILALAKSFEDEAVSERRAVDRPQEAAIEC